MCWLSLAPLLDFFVSTGDGKTFWNRKKKVTASLLYSDHLTILATCHYSRLSIINVYDMAIDLNVVCTWTCWPIGYIGNEKSAPILFYFFWHLLTDHGHDSLENHDDGHWTLLDRKDFLFLFPPQVEKCIAGTLFYTVWGKQVKIIMN